MPMVFQAFIDDSGREPTSPLFVLSGFVASHEARAAFSDEWDAALREAPAIGYFKRRLLRSLLKAGVGSKQALLF
jgi:hypothetical protein